MQKYIKHPIIDSIQLSLSLFLILKSMKEGKNPLYLVAGILVLVGALNWGLVGLGAFLGMNLNLVNLLLGAWPQVEWVVYLLVGVSALVYAVPFFKGSKAE